MPRAPVARTPPRYRELRHVSDTVFWYMKCAFDQGYLRTPMVWTLSHPAEALATRPGQWVARRNVPERQTAEPGDF